jgi:KRAB domain-containing zinc finger protein
MHALFAVTGYFLESAHSKEKSYKCEYCDHVSHRKDLVEAHIKNVHADKQRFECSLCGDVLKYKLTYEEHMHRHMGTPMKKCDECDKAFYCEISFSLRCSWLHYSFQRLLR